MDEESHILLLEAVGDSTSVGDEKPSGGSENGSIDNCDDPLEK